MNLKYMNVSLFEISYKKKLTFHHIYIYIYILDVPVCITDVTITGLTINHDKIPHG